MKLTNRRAASRTGGAFYQVVTCLLAVGAGAWIGARYMGVEMGDLAYTALDETELLDNVPDDWRPQRSDCPPEGCPPPETAEERAVQLREELNDLRLEVATLRTAVESGSPLPTTSGEQTVRREATLAYWSRLVEISNELAQLQQNVEPAASGATTGHAFDLRRRAFDYASRAIQATPYQGVDPEALEGGARLSEWFEHGAELYQQATDVWDGLAGAKRAPLAESSLNKSRAQHRKESELVRAKLAELNSLLSRRYAVAFPAIKI